MTRDIVKHLPSHHWNLFYHSQRKSLNNIFIRENNRLKKKFFHLTNTKRSNDVQQIQLVHYYAKESNSSNSTDRMELRSAIFNNNKYVSSYSLFLLSFSNILNDFLCEIDLNLMRFLEKISNLFPSLSLYEDWLYEDGLLIFHLSHYQPVQGLLQLGSNLCMPAGIRREELA